MPEEENKGADNSQSKTKPAAKKTTSKKKTLDVVFLAEDAKAKVNDIEVFGDPDLWQLLCKESSESQGWVEETKVMQMNTGCLVQVSTQQGENVAKDIEFIEGVKLATDANGNLFLNNPLKK